MTRSTKKAIGAWGNGRSIQCRKYGSREEWQDFTGDRPFFAHTGLTWRPRPDEPFASKRPAPPSRLDELEAEVASLRQRVAKLEVWLK